MNTDLMFSSKTDMWETPQDLFDQLDKEFHFTLDVCATPENAKNFTRNWKTVLFNRGKVLFGAILHMVVRLVNGYAERCFLVSPEILWSCCFPHEQIQNGFTNIFIIVKMLKCGLLKDD